MYTIGLTGNIATGKSTVARMLADLGAYVIDADRLAHEVMRPESDAYRAIVARFGPSIVSPDGAINRASLGAIVFSDRAALTDLERIVHPAVVARTLHLLAKDTTPVRVVEAIKLLEAQMHRHCDAVWVVVAPREQQVVRLMHTRGLSRQEAELRIDAQPPAAAKVARADVVIDNSGSLDDLCAQVRRAWQAIPGRDAAGMTATRSRRTP
ncbi:MAG TPA: dephospho-CoA kinase [Chloroflexi bacterium]|nr:dephospho-CoA kinase [Chloroflexota bacterium]